MEELARQPKVREYLGERLDAQSFQIDPAHPVRYGNHGCAPNLWMEDAVTVVARRAVAAGEELTVDYATQTGTEAWRMTCRCGAPAATCR